VPSAGRTIGDYIVMHNGSRVHRDSYYGIYGQMLLEKNRGVHEPQEELLFGDVIRSLKPRATMLELGAYWGFYSLWFHQAVNNAECWLIEPSAENLRYGKENFRANGARGNFHRAYIAEASGVHEDQTPIVSVDEFVSDRQIDSVDILHSDIQGAELNMLRGAQQLLETQRVGYLFVSTHSNETHYACEEQVRMHGYHVIASIDLDHSCSLDGILVAKSSKLAADRV
jgi:hypothetical protein